MGRWMTHSLLVMEHDGMRSKTVQYLTHFLWVIRMISWGCLSKKCAMSLTFCLTCCWSFNRISWGSNSENILCHSLAVCPRIRCHEAVIQTNVQCFSHPNHITKVMRLHSEKGRISLTFCWLHTGQGEEAAMRLWFSKMWNVTHPLLVICMAGFLELKASQMCSVTYSLSGS